MNKEFIKLENGEIVKLSDIKKVTKSYSSKHTNGFEPFISIRKGEPTFKLLGLIPVKFAKKDCFKLDPFVNGRYGCWYNKYYYSVKDLFDAIIKHWGEKSPGAYSGYDTLPNAEYLVGRLLTSNKNALYFDSIENAICVKPYVTLWFDNSCESPKKKFLTFNSNDELDKWMDNNINCLSLSINA